MRLRGIGNTRFFSLVLLMAVVAAATAMAINFRGDSDSGEPSTASASMGAVLTGGPETPGAAPTPAPAGSGSPGNTAAGFSSSFTSSSSAVPPPIDTSVVRIIVIDDPVLVNDADDGFLTDWLSMTISGRVTDPWGHGIAGIEVVPVAAAAGAMSHPRSFFTDSNGYYEIPIYYPGFFNIFFHAVKTGPDGISYWASEWYNNVQTHAEAPGVPHGSRGVDVVLTSTGVLKGHVSCRAKRDDYGSFYHGPDLPGDTLYSWDCPLPKDVVIFRADIQEPVKVIHVGNMLAMENDYNDFSFDRYNSLPPGNYKLLIMPSETVNRDESGSGWGPAWHGGQSWETAQTVTVTPGQLTSIEAYIEPSVKASLYGSLRVDDWSPFLPESVVALVDATDPSRVIATRNNASYFVFDEVTAGDAYKLRFTSTVGQTFWYLDNRQYATEDFDAATMISIPDDPATSASMGPLDFSVWTRTATAAGRVIRADGTPIPHADVLAIETGSQRFDPLFMGLTESDGRFSSSLVPGSYSFCVYDWETGTRYCHDIAVTLGDHESATDIDIVIPSAAAPVPAATAAISDPAQPVTTIEAHSGDETPSADTASEADDPSPAPDSATMSAADEKTR